jgi:hypothetical protein
VDRCRDSGVTKEREMRKIRNINDKFGDAIAFEGADLPSAVSNMAWHIWRCGSEVAGGQTYDDLCRNLREGIDYEIVD